MRQPFISSRESSREFERSLASGTIQTPLFPLAVPALPAANREHASNSLPQRKIRTVRDLRRSLSRSAPCTSVNPLVESCYRLRDEVAPRSLRVCKLLSVRRRVGIGAGRDSNGERGRLGLPTAGQFGGRDCWRVQQGRRAARSAAIRSAQEKGHEPDSKNSRSSPARTEIVSTCSVTVPIAPHLTSTEPDGTSTVLPCLGSSDPQSIGTLSEDTRNATAAASPL